jgi:hypothetical protein
MIRLNLEKLDHIVLTEDDATRIMNWDKDNHHKHSQDEFNFPLTEGVVEVESYFEPIKTTFTTLTYFKIEEDGILFRQFDKADMKEIVSFKVAGSDDEEFGEGFSDVKSYVSRAQKVDVGNTIRMTTYLCFCVFKYMTIVEKHVVEEKERKTIIKKQKSKKSSKSNKSKVVKISTSKYKFNFNNNPRDYERQTFAWNVRGHWRYYKNGNKVWVSPYTKGDKKDVETKEYRI